MLATVKVLRTGDQDQITDIHSVYLPTADEETPIVSTRIMVFDGSLVVVNENGEAAVIDDLDGADKALLSFGGYDRTIWPAVEPKKP